MNIGFVVFIWRTLKLSLSLFSLLGSFSSLDRSSCYHPCISDAEWESFLPEDMVSFLAHARVALRARHAAVEILLEVKRPVHATTRPRCSWRCVCARRSATTVVRRVVTTRPSAASVWSRGRGAAGSVHAFYRGCISEWFRRKSTCPPWRDDMHGQVSGPRGTAAFRLSGRDWLIVSSREKLLVRGSERHG
jgi:hypothetical protein